jgi:hypothetical protein
MHFLVALIERGFSRKQPWSMPGPDPIRYRSARDGVYVDNDRKLGPIYLARAEGHLFERMQRL